MFSKSPVLGFFAALVFVLHLPGAHADGAFRTVLVIDASSSMKRTDPHRVRQVAAELFVDLARRGDAIAVTGFDGGARQSTGEFIVISGPESRQRLKQAIRAIGNDGQWTDFTAGLSEARALLGGVAKKPGDQELIVFLTDGRCEPDPAGVLAQGVKNPAEREQICQDAVLRDLVPGLGGARVYAIGLSKNAPEAFLTELGRRTGGQGAVTLDPETLPRLFAGVYARLLGSRLQEGEARDKATVQVYEGTETLDVVVVGRTDASEMLTDPQGAAVAMDNRDPDAVYFVGATEYRLYKLHRPRAGIWTLATGSAKKRRFATLQHFDLGLSLVDLPAAVETGEKLTIRGRLATPSGAIPPAEFLDRHAMTALLARPGEPGEPERLAMTRGPGGVFVVDVLPKTLGEHTVGLLLDPGPAGVLSRQAPGLGTFSVVPPVHLRVAPVTVAPVQQGQTARFTLSLAGSQVGVPPEIELALADPAGSRDRTAGIVLAPAAISLSPGGADSFALDLAVDKDAAAGRRDLAVTLTPGQGFADRAVTVPLAVEILPLSFWERYGTVVTWGAAGLFALFVLLGLVTPASFKKRAILYYADARDPELVRRSSYPLGTRARSGFYRPARLALGPTGPVKKAGVVTLVARGGGGIAAVPASGATVLKVSLPAPGDDDDPDAVIARELADDERPRVPLKDGSFVLSAGVGYEIKGSGLVFWYK